MILRYPFLVAVNVMMRPQVSNVFVSVVGGGGSLSSYMMILLCEM